MISVVDSLTQRKQSTRIGQNRYSRRHLLIVRDRLTIAGDGALCRKGAGVSTGSEEEKNKRRVPWTAPRSRRDELAQPNDKRQQGLQIRHVLIPAGNWV
jgi:hypothetical protein